jgi:hypothetical protein
MSPPSSMMLLESPKTLEEKETAVQAAAGTHGEFWGPTVSGGSLRVRRGLPRHFELAGEASAHAVTDAGAVEMHRGIYSARLSSKYAPIPHVAFALGAGGGYAPAGGGFFSPDAALFLGYENPYFIPFASLRGFVSEPIRAKLVDVSEPNEAPGTRVFQATTTYGTSFALGFRIPFGEWPGRDRWDARPSLTFGYGWTWLWDDYVRTGEDPGIFMNLALGAELAF